MRRRTLESGTGPGCLSMVQSYGRNRPMSRVDRVIEGLGYREEWQKPGLTLPQRVFPKPQALRGAESWGPRASSP